MHVFVTSTNPHTGKTFISAGLAAVMQSLGYKAGVYKPIQTKAIEQNGFLVSPDLSFVKQLDFYVETACTYTFKTNLAPVIASELENLTIQIENIKRDYSNLKEKVEISLVEDAGGLLEPITDDKFVVNIAKELEIPVLIIVDAQKESISSILSTINTAKQYDLNIVGIIINKYPSINQNIATKTLKGLIEAYSDIKVLGTIPEIENFSQTKPGTLINILINNVNIENIFKIKIPKLNLTND